MTCRQTVRAIDTAMVFASRVALPVEPPARIKVCPWGVVQLKDGPTFTLDAAAAKEILARFGESVDLPVDREHATLGGEYASPDGSAPAMAWIKSLEAVPGEGLYAGVEWTAAGAAHVRAKEYRYLSPVVLVRKTDRRAIELHSVALTNKPRIVGMPPIAAKDRLIANNEDLWERSRWFLNLPTTATENEIMEEFEKLMAQLREMAGVGATADQAATVAALKARLADAAAKAAVCRELGIAETAATEEIVAKITKAKADAVSAEALTKANERIAAMEKEILDGKAAAFIERGMKAGKIVEANKALWDRIFRAGPEQAARDLEASPVIAPPDGRAVGPQAAGGAGVSPDRTALINKARGEFKSQPDLARMTTVRAYVAAELRAAGLDSKLTEDEAKLACA